jgi:hypothetical protein
MPRAKDAKDAKIGALGESMPLPTHSMKLLLLSFAALAAFARGTFAAEPFLKPHDVIALVGGEDLVAASEYGYLELLLQRALPGHELKVRSLAWEGDTVFAQPRDLNYPTLEAQLDELGATVVVLQFGQMESLAGTSKLPEFIAAYEKLIERVSAGGKRRVVVIEPSCNGDKTTITAYAAAVASLVRGGNIRSVSSPSEPASLWSHDGVHLADDGQCDLANSIGHVLHPITEDFYRLLGTGLARADNYELHHMLADIRAKNRLWFHYTRPQNWAFLNGDRTEQPSSRDHKDPSKRWFPEEMKQWLPLIDAKEKEIWALAAKAGAEGRPTNKTK